MSALYLNDIKQAFLPVPIYTLALSLKPPPLSPPPPQASLRVKCEELKCAGVRVGGLEGEVEECRRELVEREGEIERLNAAIAETKVSGPGMHRCNDDQIASVIAL